MYISPVDLRPFHKSVRIAIACSQRNIKVFIRLLLVLVLQYNWLAQVAPVGYGLENNQK